MVRRVPTLLVVSLLLGTAFASTGVASGASGGPSIQVAVNGDRVADEEWVVVHETTLSVSVDSTAELGTVVVRVDGEDVATFAPDGTRFDRAVDLDLGARNNDVQVIATDENDDTSSYLVTVYRDTVPPAIGLSSPFTVQPGYVFPRNVTDAEPNVSVVGTVEDVSNVTEFEARIVGDGVVRTTTLSNTSTFALNTTLGLGNSTLRIRATDEYGNERIVRTRLEVTDESGPTVNVTDWPENVSTDTFTATVRATDDVGIEAVRVRPTGQTQRYVLEPTTSLFDKGRDAVIRDVTIDLHRPGVHNVTFNATDMANHSTEIQRTVRYDPVTPEEAAVPVFSLAEHSSGLADEGTYQLNATFANGSMTRVVVESVTADRQRVLSYGVIYNGGDNETTETVTIDRTLPVDGRTEIHVRATDEFGATHRETIAVNPRNESAYLQTSTAPTQSPTTGQAETTSDSTPAVTNVAVQTETPLTPVTDTSVPFSPLLVPLAAGIALVLLDAANRRR